MPMHELVRSSLQSKLFGSGFPERMRSAAFAFLGLTAAAGLALVAIFAQLSFPLLSPAPLPSGPAEGNAVSEAVALGHGPGAFIHANPGAVGSGERSARADNGSGSGGGSGQASEPQGSTPSAPTAIEPGGGASGGVAVETPTSNSAPAPSSTPGPSPEPAGAPDPAPAPKPPPTPARPAAPTPPPAPGNSQSSAAASHASERGVEASSKSTPEPTTSGVTGSTPEASPGNGNGKALGHGK
jgi:hypothetical protein